jgi:hypothetical protein
VRRGAFERSENHHTPKCDGWHKQAAKAQEIGGCHHWLHILTLVTIFLRPKKAPSKIKVAHCRVRPARQQHQIAVLD